MYFGHAAVFLRNRCSLIVGPLLSHFGSLFAHQLDVYSFSSWLTIFTTRTYYCLFVGTLLSFFRPLICHCGTADLPRWIAVRPSTWCVFSHKLVDDLYHAGIVLSLCGITALSLWDRCSPMLGRCSSINLVCLLSQVVRRSFPRRHITVSLWARCFLFLDR